MVIPGTFLTASRKCWRGRLPISKEEPELARRGELLNHSTVKSRAGVRIRLLLQFPFRYASTTSVRLCRIQPHAINIEAMRIHQKLPALVSLVAVQSFLREPPALRAGDQFNALDTCGLGVH